MNITTKIQIARMAGLRGNCATCSDPVTHDGRKWVHDHVHQSCMGHQQGTPWAFRCGWVCDFPHEVAGAKDVTR